MYKWSMEWQSLMANSLLIGPVALLIRIWISWASVSRTSDLAAMALHLRAYSMKSSLGFIFSAMRSTMVGT